MSARKEDRRAKRTTRQLVVASAMVAATLCAANDCGTPTAASSPVVRDAAPLSVDLALGGTATASSEADGHPAGNAIDGSATTSWCATQWTGDVVVELGAAKRIYSVGVTLAATASASTVAISLGTEPDSWQPLASAHNIALNGNTPSYVALPGDQAVRYARITVPTGDGAPACVGEIRLFGRDRATDRMMLGADLSFTLQEEAAGTVFTDAGKASDPVRILRAHGGNFVRMRLWLAPSPGYSDLASALARRPRRPA
jgi:hypothetical protein